MRFRALIYRSGEWGRTWMGQVTDVAALVLPTEFDVGSFETGPEARRAVIMALRAKALMYLAEQGRNVVGDDAAAREIPPPRRRLEPKRRRQRTVRRQRTARLT